MLYCVNVNKLASIFAVLLLSSLSACNPGALNADGDGGTGGGNGGLDPANPPPNPFPDDSFPDDGICGEINAVVDGLTPTVQLLIDQSGSMNNQFGGGERWGAVYSTLMEDGGVVNQLQSTIRFGLSLFTSDGGNAGGECPVMTNVGASLDNRAAIDAVFGNAGPQGDTPTGESIDAVVTLLQADANPGRKVIVLGTDGLPDTCEQPNPNMGEAVSIAAAQRAFEAGIRVYVVSVGDDVGADHLQDMANAGAGLAIGGMDNAEFFVALNPQDLVDAFDVIVGGVSGCVFTINGEVDPGKAASGHVSLDGVELDFGTQWNMVDGRSFEVLGAACETIKDGELHHVAAVFPCGVIQID